MGEGFWPLGGKVGFREEYERVLSEWERAHYAGKRVWLVACRSHGSPLRVIALIAIVAKDALDARARVGGVAERAGRPPLRIGAVYELPEGLVGEGDSDFVQLHRRAREYGVAAIEFRDAEEREPERLSAR